MPEGQWDEQLKRFLKKTGEDLKRAGGDIRDEAQRLMREVRDPEKQKKVKEGFKELGALARKAAEEVATAVEAGVKKAEEALKPRASATPPSPPPRPPRASKPKAAKGAKTIGRKRS